MGYRLGVDIGTTYTAAAVCRDGVAEMLGLGNRAMQIPSVLYRKPDGAFLVGEAAEARAAAEPERIVREFKRRIGDPVPLLVDGAPFSAEALTARLLSWVVDFATERQGSPPDSITVSHPANWGPYKIDLQHQAFRLADLDDVATISEPEAAALTYAMRRGVSVGESIAVYDLGGGTFDAAVLRRMQDGFVLVGRPEGIDHLGGVDFDEAVFQHVLQSLGVGAGSLDPDDPQVVRALERLRRDCVAAKETLSIDVEAIVAVAIGDLHTTVRLTRGEFEEMLRPSLEETIGTMRRVLRSADLEPHELSAVVLVGGSSRIPLVTEMLSGSLGRPIRMDTHPKHDIALGAAMLGEKLTRQSPTVPMPDVPAPPAPDGSSVPARSDGPRSRTQPLRGAAASSTAAASASWVAGMKTHRRAVFVGAALVAAVVVLAATIAAGVFRSSGNGSAAGRGKVSDSSSAPRESPTKQTSSVAKSPDLLDPGPLVVLAHRGGDEAYAEETLPAFLAAAKAGAAVETDVRWTLDGVAVLVHDPRTALPMQCQGGPYAVANTKWSVLQSRCRSEVSASQDGRQYPIPTFDDALSQIAKIPGAQLFAEVKVNQTPAEVSSFVQFIVQNKMTKRIVVTSFLPAELAKIHAEAIRDGLTLRLLRFVSNKVSVTELGKEHLFAAAITPAVETGPYIAGIRRMNVAVIVYTVNTTADWARAKQLGADTVLTDTPDAYKKWLAGQ